VKVEEFLSSLPQNIITGEDVQLPERSFREIFDFVKLGKDDVFYHLGCGDGAGLEIARKEFHAKKVVGIDNNEEKISAARGRKIEKCEACCEDVRNVEFSDATVVLFWFSEQGVAEQVAGKFQKIPPGCRIITILDPLLDFRPDEVLFPYLLHRTPLTRAKDIREQLVSVFGVECIDFVTSWEHAERYTRSIGGTGVQNDRFLTILQSVIIWINARNLNVTCDQEMPESVKTYISILREFFNIEVEHLLKK